MEFWLQYASLQSLHYVSIWYPLTLLVQGLPCGTKKTGESSTIYQVIIE